MFEKNVIQKQLQDGKLVPQGGIDGVVWSTREGLKLELDFDHLADNIAYDSISEAVLFFWDYDNARPIWTQKVDVAGQTFQWNYDSSLWRMMNLLKMEAVRVGIVFFINSDLQCRYIRNRFLMDNENAPENKYAIGVLDRKDKTILSATWTGNSFLSLKLRSDNSFTKQYYRAEVSGYRYENGHFIFYIELPLMEGEINLSFGGDFDNKIKESGESIFIIDEKENTSISRIVKIDFDAVKACSIGIEEGCLTPIAILNHQSFPFIASETVIDDEIYELSTDYKASIRRNEEGYLKIICATEIYDVLLSVVTAVYNTAPFLSEMIESVLSQKVNKLNDYIKDKMYKNIFEFILVDDGSTDGSAEILDNYAAMFDCIKVIHKENGGVSSARNAGLDIARGKYVNFADSDDKLSENFMEECLKFFEQHENEICMITTPMIFFDAEKGDHWTNYKFQKNNTVVDLDKHPDALNYFVCSSLYKMTDIATLRFDTELVNGEDIKFIYQILNDKCHKIGTVSSTKYDYRRRSIGEKSAIQATLSDRRTYTDYLKKVLEFSLINARQEDGSIPMYVQQMVMGQLQWKCNLTDKGEKGKELLGEDGYQEYKRVAFDLLKYLDGEVILGAKKIFNEVKYFLLKKKYNCVPDLLIENGASYFYFKNNRISTSLENTYIRLEFMEFIGDALHIEGYGMNFEPDVELVIYVNDTIVEYKENLHDTDKYCFDEICFYSTTFSLNIELDVNQFEYVITFANRYKGTEVKKRTFRYTNNIPLAITYNKSYYSFNSWTLRKEDNKFVIRNNLLMDKLTDYEKEFVEEIRKKKDTPNLEYMLRLRSLAMQKLSCKGNKKIWLLSDRVNVAGDNGEALFRYLSIRQDKSVDAYFLINGDAADFSRMKEFGKVIPRNTEAHYLLQLTADYIISSAGEHVVFNPWTEDYRCSEIVRDLLAKSQYIFLQHGITINDVSGWLNRYNKNIRGFVCAAPREAQSILDYDYYYDSKNIWLTGFARHDRLYHDEQKMIVIMPTWRRFLAIDGDTENRLVPNFTESEYFKFYDSLINNEKLIDASIRLGYQLCFMPHPGIKRHGLQFFHRDARVRFLDFNITYRDVFARANLVMTDYSSAVMDFAYLHKPIVYCQFDKEIFFKNHIVKHGYFDYERDGFGEVTYDLYSCIDVMITYMENDCKVHDPYGERMDQFFAFHDKNNAQRIYDKIKEISLNEYIK